MNNRIKDIIIDSSVSIIEALKQMDTIKRKLLMVVENNHLKSMLSIGDIQRAIISNVSMEACISQILRNEVKVASVMDNRDSVISFMRERRNEFMPIIDDKKNIVDVIFWEDLFSNDITQLTGKEKIDLPVVIMAGGKGSRLAPLTNVLPKPLIPIHKKTMLEDIMDQFVKVGCSRFYLSVNYKAEMIRYYFDTLRNEQYNISYFQEDKPLGTAGSLHLLKDKISTTFFVSNCDIIIDQDYSEILKYHRENGNEITLVATLKHYPIPYGTITTKEDGLLDSITEKPEYVYKINAGLYILEPHLIDEIPQEQFYHITTLIEKLQSEGRKVGVFPVSEGSWTDIGNWEEYIKCIKY